MTEFTRLCLPLFVDQGIQLPEGQRKRAVNYVHFAYPTQEGYGIARA